MASILNNRGVIARQKNKSKKKNWTFAVNTFCLMHDFNTNFPFVTNRDLQTYGPILKSKSNDYYTIFFEVPEYLLF